MSTEHFLRVAVDAPLLSGLTYKSSQSFQVGQSVFVPLGKRTVSAVILGEGGTAGDFEIRAVQSANEDRPTLPPHFLKWLEWIADYYVHPIGLVVEQAFPPLATKTSKRKSNRAPVVKSVERSTAPILTEEQDKCIQSIMGHKEFYTHLLHGVTGSGKTEVYLHLLENTLRQGQRGLVLVPEIALTPQLIQRFSARFGDEIAVLHSHLTDRERTTQWWSIYNGEKKILIGARSALFCPIPDLGLIIVDEEHEPSYKQDEKLKYNARDCAIMLAKLSNIPIVLGSATPSLETWRNAIAGRYALHTMKNRVGERSLPQVRVVDLRVEKEVKKESADTSLPFWLSTDLYNEIAATLNRKEQVALFLNRRGMAPTVLCSDCGYIYRCPNCAISLTLHGKKNLVCHYCDYASQLGDACESCKIGEPKPLGLGTEQVEEEIKKLFPEARVARADRDEIHSREALENLIEDMESHRIDILVGTQMIAKGLDFTKLTLVGLLLADVGFNLPDFRATERSFQLLTQVSGRAGRHVQHGGQVIIQTYNPENPSVIYAKDLRYEDFATFELDARKELLYPPFGRLASLRITAKTPRLGQETAERLADRCEDLKKLNAHYKDIQVLGPAEAPLAKLRGKFRYHLLLKTSAAAVLSPFCRQLLADSKWIPAGTKVQVDIDPINLL